MNHLFIMYVNMFYVCFLAGHQTNKSQFMTPYSTTARSNQIRVNPEPFSHGIRKRPYYTKKSRRPSLQGKIKIMSPAFSSFSTRTGARQKTLPVNTTLFNDGTKQVNDNEDDADVNDDMQLIQLRPEDIDPDDSTYTVIKQEKDDMDDSLAGLELS